MKLRKLLLVCFALVASTNLSSQAFQQGDIIISGGYGWPNLTTAIFNVLDTYDEFETGGLGPAHFKVEYGYEDKVGVGLSVNYVHSWASFEDQGFHNGNSVLYNYRYTRTNIAFNGRVNFHFGTSESVDPYAGVGIGYRFGKQKLETNDPFYVDNLFRNVNLSPIGFEATVGIRYFPVPFVGLYAELGLAKSIVQGGLSIKI